MPSLASTNATVRDECNPERSGHPLTVRCLRHLEHLTKVMGNARLMAPARQPQKDALKLAYTSRPMGE